MGKNKHPEVKAEMMIRQPALDVYEYFVDPAKLSTFWLSSASARLEVGKKVLWKFKIAGAEDTVAVEALEPGKRIAIVWDKDVRVEWLFIERNKTQTMVCVSITNIPGTFDEQFSYAVDVSQGFMIVLLELKALLEKGIVLNAIYDKFPDLEHV